MKKEVLLILTITILTSQVLAFEFCDEGTQGEREIRIISVDDMLKENSKEWTWQESQKIEIEIRVENKNDDSETYILEAIFKDGEKTEKIATDSEDLEKEFSLSANERKSISLEFEIDEDLDPENYDLYVKLYKKGHEDEQCVENSEEKIKIEEIKICEEDEVDEDELEITDIKDEKEDNENSWKWTPGDDIEISLNLENKYYSERDFAIELIFLNDNSEEVFLADNSKEVYIEKNIEEDEQKDIRFNFKIRSNIEEGEYTLYAKAYDTEDEDICTSLKAEDKSSPIIIYIEKDERKVIIENIKGPETLKTSSKTQYNATITNLGSKDEEKVLAIAYNNLLKINERIEIENLEAGESKNITFTIEIPENATLQRQAIIFSTEYDYNERQDYYKEESDENDDIKYYVTIEQEEKEEENPQKTNETIITEKTTEENKTISTVITGNVIGTPNEFPSWIIIGILIILVIAGIIFFFKKPKPKKQEVPEAPRVIRRYTAKLD